MGDIHTLEVCNTAGAFIGCLSERAMQLVLCGGLRHYCRPSAIPMELHQHVAVHGEQPLASLATNPEFAVTLQPNIPLRERDLRLEARRYNPFASLAD